MSTLDLTLIKQQVQSTENVYISTLNGEGYPVTRVMFNLHNAKCFPKQADFIGKLKGDFCIYLGTNAASTKVADMLRTPHVSAYYHVQGSWQGMLIVGNAEVVSDKEIRHGLWQDEWSMYYEGGVEGTDYTILKLRPILAEYYHNLSKEILRFSEDNK